jgi:hypothetical protein
MGPAGLINCRRSGHVLRDATAFSDAESGPLSGVLLSGFLLSGFLLSGFLIRAG